MAIGSSTGPVAPGTAAGDAVTRNSHRLRRAASLLTASRSRLSKNRHPHRDQRQGMNRFGDALNAGGMDVLGAVDAKNGRVMLAEPSRACHVETSQLIGVVRPFGIAEHPSAGADEDDKA